MNKISILGLCLLTATAMSAQKTVVKEAERAMKSGKPFTEVVTIITPAMTNPETAQLAETFYIPGKAGIKQYDDLLGKKSLGMLPDGGASTMANALMGAYDYFLKALPLDQLPDEKGKVKPKYTKDIISQISGHYNDFNSIAVDFWNEKDYNNAYRAWGIFLGMPADPVFGQSVKAFPDSTIAEIYYNQALAAWQADSLANAINSFRKALKMGYDKKQIFDYGVAVASNAKDNEALLEFASAGNKLFGHEDVQYLNQIINYYLQTEKYDEALNFLNAGLADDPNNAQYYSLRGIILDNQDKRDEAITEYEQALKLDPENGLANFYIGRGIASKAGKLSDDYSGTAYESYKTSTLDPMYRQAAEYLEKAYNIDKNNRGPILKVLEIVYYNLNDEAAMKSVSDRKLDD